MPREFPHKSKVSDGVGWPLERRPELATCIARVATFWSRIEERLAQAIAQLMEAQPSAGMSLLQALPASNDQLALARTLARERLDEAHCGRFEDLLRRYEDAEWKRNKVVRGHWYVSDDHADALVWADPAEELSKATDFWTGFQAASAFGDQVKFARDYARPRPEYLLFDKSDFETILEEIRGLGFALTDFALEIAESRKQPVTAES